MEQNKQLQIHFKYHLIVKWPEVCRNRNMEVMMERPDLVDQMNKFRIKLNNICKLILRKGYKIDENHNLDGVSLWFESGQDTYDFIIRQPEFNWEILPELGIVSYLTGDFKKYNVVYTPSGILID